MHLSHDYVCKVCGESYSRSSTLQGHMSVHSEEIHVEVSQASDSFDTCCHGNNKSGDCPDCSDGSTGKNLAIRNTSSFHNNEETKRASTGSTLNNEVLSKRPADRSVRVKTAQKRKDERGIYFECELCKQRLTQLSSLRGHMRIHTGERPYKCKDCEKSFTFYQCLWNHAWKHTGNKNFECKLCSKKYTHYQSLWNHNKTHKGVKPYDCKVCGKEYMYKHYLEKHLGSHTGEMPYKCTLCNKGFMHHIYLKLHYKIHSPEKPFECYACKRTFTYFTSFLRHEKQHTEQNSEDLKDAMKKNVSIPKKKRESARLRNEKHRCNSKRQGAVTRTKSRTDPTKIPKKEHSWSCHVCGKNVASSVRLKNHLRIHTGEKPYKCLLCPKAFIDSIGLWKHKKVHEGETLCENKASFEKDFVHSPNRKGHDPSTEDLHQRKKSSEMLPSSSIHDKPSIAPGDIKSFECEVCNEKFKLSSSFKGHVMKYSSIKPYSWEECNREYKLKGWLSLHSYLAHKNSCEKSSIIEHVCKYCESVFLSVDDVTDHQKSIKCKNCDDLFHCSYEYYRHSTTCFGQNVFGQEALTHKGAESTKAVFKANHSKNDAIECDENFLGGYVTFGSPISAGSVSFELDENLIVHDNNINICDAQDSSGSQVYHHPDDSSWDGFFYQVSEARTHDSHVKESG